MSKASDTKILSFCIDSNENAYMSLYGNEKIFHWNYSQSQATYTTLPLVSNEIFDPTFGDNILIMLDEKNNLIGFYRDFVYYFNNGKFNSVKLKDSTTIASGSPINVKIDIHGNIFQNGYNAIYKMEEKWNPNSYSIVFHPGDSTVVDNFFPYDSTHNFAVVNSQKTGMTDVYLYHSHKPFAKKLVSSRYTPMRRNSYVSPDGEIYLPTSIGLLHYSEVNNSYQLNMPVIEPNLGSSASVNRIYKSIKNNFLIAYLRPGFYFSYDGGFHWIKPTLINQEFPIEINSIANIYAIDTGKIIIHATDECAYDIIFEYNTYTGWNRINANTENSYFLNLQKLQNSKIILANDYDCNWSISKDDGKNWKILYSPGKFFQRLKVMASDLEQYCYTWLNSTLYRSTDPSLQWDSIAIVPGGIDQIHAIGGTELLATKILDPRNPATDVILSKSTDRGQSWVRLAKVRSSELPSDKFIKDLDGNLLAWNTFQPFTGVSISKDQGKTWTKDIRFSMFTGIISIQAYGSNSYYIIGRTLPPIKFEHPTLYYTEDFIDFKELTPNLNTSVASLHILGKNELLITLRINEMHTSPFLYSDQNGENWVNVSGNFSRTIPQGKVSLILANFLDSENHMYISLGNDGLYKTVKPVQTKDEKPNHDQLSIHQSGPGRIRIAIPDFLQNSDLQIYSIDMKEFMQVRLKELESLIQFPHIPGIYLARIENYNMTVKFCVW